MTGSVTLVQEKAFVLFIGYKYNKFKLNLLNMKLLACTNNQDWVAQTLLKFN